MPNQERSKDGIPRKDPDRPTPDVKPSPDVQSQPHPRSGEEKGSMSGEEPAAQDHSGEGPGKVGLTSDEQPDLVSRSGVNEGDHGAADDKPQAGGSVNLDDDDMVHPRGKVTSSGGTWQAKGGDSAPLGAPREILSDRNGPSDPDNRRK
jgi:hypothetical protein